MVDKKEVNTPVEAPCIKQTKKYVVIKNHVRELLPKIECSVPAENDISENFFKITNHSRKRKKESLETLPSEAQSTVICKDDLEELRTVYEKCKAVVKKIELKYGHLLGLDDEERFRKDTENQYVENTTDSCSCSLNRKIVFDENGQQLEKICTLENHICPDKINKHNLQHKTPAIQVEYDNIIDYLPNNLSDLENILKDQSIDRSYRELVINKMYLIRQEHFSQIKNERKSLIEILKANPDELLDFKGTNVSSLPGYPTKPLNKQAKTD